MAFMTTDQTALPSSSSSPTRWKYDVFLSFHGEDTRKSFTAHMYAALEQRGIYTFRDDERLERGNYISLELLKAIKESKYAIIVFSMNYAFSKWCLIELAKIVECMKENRLAVFTVFYHVDPSQVRNQKGTFAKAFVKHGKDPDIDIKRIQTWRAALEEVGNIAGWHLHDRDESTTIKEIVGKILSQLNRTCSTVSEELFGIDSPVDEMWKLLRRKSDDVRFVGICGMGGIGKTTLAEVVFNRISNQFQATSFIGCVREETGYRGLVSLQKQLLSQILEEEKINIWDVRGGINMIKNRLFSRKVLIVLDDVDKEQQLEALAGNHDWFGPGSRIIVTSRDGHLLKRHVDDIYMATGLGHADALQLFCWKAFKKPYPEENYVDLCKEFVKYANGLPLALKVLGSSLYGRGRNEWESARDKLKANPNREVLDILEIGFHSLGVTERRLFLDIACFFKREIKKDLIIDLLESSGYPPHIDIAILVDKSLLTVCVGNSFSMHDLLQEMGQEIVRRESPEEPGRRSRLWLLEDALEMLSNNTGTNVVEGIVLNLPFQKEENLNAETFSKMKKLRLLKIRYGQLPEDLSYLSNELRLLEWFGYPLKSFPSTFQPDKLVELRMPCSQIKQLWINGTKRLCKLKLIDLSYSRNLDKMPNFNKIPNLEKLILQECTSLPSVHQSIGVLRRLIVLNLRGCKSFANLPENIGSMECLKELDASETAITRIPSSISLLKNLQNLSLHGCKGLAHKPWESIFSSWLLQKESSDPIGRLSWRNTFSSLSSLRSLDLSDCNILDGAIPDDLSGLSSLQSLNLSGNEFTSLTDGICQVSKLKEVFFRNCRRLQALPKLPSGIAFVWAENCASLNIYSDQIYFWCSSEQVVTLCCSRMQSAEEESLRSLLRTDPDRPNPSLRRILESCDPNVRCGPSWAAEIPKWFDKQSTSSSVTTRMHPTSDGNEWMGCALFVIYEAHELETSNFRISERSDTTLDLKDVHQFVCDFETNEGRLKQPLVLNNPKVPFVGPTGFWVYIPYVWFSEQSNNPRKKENKKRSNYKPDRWRYIVASITTGSPGVEVKKLGMRILYERHKDGKEFAESIDRCSSGVFSGERSTFRKVAQCMSNLPTRHVGEADQCVSMTCIPCPLSNEDHGLKGVLLSLLLQCFEVKHAKNKVYKYIFPLRASPPWFIDHRFGRSIRIPLPVNLYDDIRWIGFAVYACFAVKENTSVSHDSKLTSRNFSCLLSTDDGCIQSSTIFPLTRDIFRESHRLLVFHIPRLSFTHKLNQQNAIRALFGTSSSDVEAHVCGMRVVYEHQVEGFVQAVVDCILGSPEGYHQGYKRSLVHQLNSDLPRNVHQAGSESVNASGRKTSSTGHSDYSPTSQRLRICTSTESLPKLPSSVEHLADCFDHQRVFNNCFPQSDIPKIFCSDHSGPLLTFRPCPDIYNSSDWSGIAVCAIFTFLKHSTLVHNSLGLEISRGLTCYFGSDVGWTISIHKNNTESEFTKSSWLNQCEFLWLLYIPRASILDKLKPWNLLKALFVSKSQGLMVQKCGHALVYQQNVEELVRMITHCSSTFFL
ncbi:TMV resistance protein N-like [Juglans microcarpa x Juglans regia]|uniref:TMV resistance protein N-like n=1 Tax=Juglans microcarpa x Juglans regia TaxID=2249226 RepID=UPI001B7F518D|nr:TMV resistance protein N-like [Juglans microcarpa x Juglans regia]